MNRVKWTEWENDFIKKMNLDDFEEFLEYVGFYDIKIENKNNDNTNEEKKSHEWLHVQMKHLIDGDQYYGCFSDYEVETFKKINNKFDQVTVRGLTPAWREGMTELFGEEYKTGLKRHLDRIQKQYNLEPTY